MPYTYKLENIPKMLYIKQIFTEQDYNPESISGTYKSDESRRFELTTLCPL
jgi:hypothetical protein